MGGEIELLLENFCVGRLVGQLTSFKYVVRGSGQTRS